jgi:mannose-1-phosphate guanylyltransferase
MYSLILSAGLGTRLGDVSNTVPKVLTKVGDIPLLDFWLEKVNQISPVKIFVNVHHLANLVENHILSSSNKHKVTLVREPELLGTGGSVKNLLVQNEIDELLVLHGDNFGNIDLKKVVSRYKNRPSTCDSLMVTFITNDVRSCGIVEVNKAGVLKKYREKPEFSKSNLANAAIFIFSSKALDRIKTFELNVFDLSKDILPTFINNMYTYHFSDFFTDIGTQEKLKFANSYFSSGWRQGDSNP